MHEDADDFAERRLSSHGCHRSGKARNDGGLVFLDGGRHAFLRVDGSLTPSLSWFLKGAIEASDYSLALLRLTRLG